MLTFTNDFSVPEYYHFPNINPEDILYFDIETTGFSADTSSLYLIGCCYQKNNTFHFIQWFADTYDSELDLLHAFFEFFKNFSALVHFNGDTFDLPYLQKKCIQYSLPYNFSSIQSIDIYKRILPYRKKLCFFNLKFKTLEQFLCISRKDTMDGRKLIKLYGTYMQERFKNKNPEKLNELQHLLLLHNQEDVQNLPAVTQILTNINFFQTLPRIKNISFSKKAMKNDSALKNHITTNQCIVTFHVSKLFTHMIKKENGFFFQIPNTESKISLTFSDTVATLSFPIIHDTLKYFYSDYKNYFYLSKEDKAIHKSVGIYVEKEYRKKATADTAYLKQTGVFLPQLEIIYSPSFQYKRKDNITFFLLTSEFDTNTPDFQIFLLQWWKELLLT